MYDWFLLLFHKSCRVIKEISEIWEGLKGGVDFCISNVGRENDILRVTDITKPLRLLVAPWLETKHVLIFPASIHFHIFHSYFLIWEITHPPFVSSWWNSESRYLPFQTKEDPVSYLNQILPTQNSKRIEMKPDLGQSIDNHSYSGVSEIKSRTFFINQSFSYWEIIPSWLQAFGGDWIPEQRMQSNHDTQHSNCELGVFQFTIAALLCHQCF